MNALILCAGEGQRLRPLTSEIPKPLMTIRYNKSVLLHLINDILGIGTIQKVFLNVSWKKDKIYEAVRNLDRDRIVIIDEGERAWGQNQTVRFVLQKNNADLLVCYGDIFCRNFPWEHFVKFWRQIDVDGLIVVDNRSPLHVGGCVYYRGISITSIEEKPQELKTLYDRFGTLSGILILRQGIERKLKKEESNLARALGAALKERKIKLSVYPTTTQITDIGEPRRYLELNDNLHLKEMKRLIDETNGQIYPLWQLICENKGTIYLLGNGGSASVAEHLALDFTKAAGKPAQCLVDISRITAFSNDGSFQDAFAEIVKTSPIREQDILFLISSSGQSENVIRAAIEAKRKGTIVVSISGGGKLASLADVAVIVNTQSVSLVEDIAQHIGHRIVELFKIWRMQI